MVKLDVKKISLYNFVSKQNYLNNMDFQSLSPLICLMAYHLHEFIADNKGLIIGITRSDILWIRESMWHFLEA